MPTKTATKKKPPTGITTVSEAEKTSQEMTLSVHQPKALVPIKQDESKFIVAPAFDADPYQGIAREAFDEDAASKLMAPVDPNDIEIRPDGILYLPEIKYRRVLNQAFGPGAWALRSRSDYHMQQDDKEQKGTLSREYALYIHGRFVSEARGQQNYYPTNKDMTYADATEGVKSNALVRTCKDLGIASELWDPDFIDKWIDRYAIQVWVEGKQKPQWRRKDRKPFYKEGSPVGAQRPAGNQQQTTNNNQQKSNPPQEDNGNRKTYELTDKHKQLRTEMVDFVKKFKDIVADDFKYSLTGDDKKDIPILAGLILKKLTAFDNFQGCDRVEQVSPKAINIALHKFHEGRKVIEQEYGEKNG